MVVLKTKKFEFGLLVKNGRKIHAKIFMPNSYNNYTWRVELNGMAYTLHSLEECKKFIVARAEDKLNMLVYNDRVTIREG